MSGAAPPPARISRRSKIIVWFAKRPLRPTTVLLHPTARSLVNSLLTTNLSALGCIRSHLPPHFVGLCRDQNAKTARAIESVAASAARFWPPPLAQSWPLRSAVDLLLVWANLLLVLFMAIFSRFLLDFISPHQRRLDSILRIYTMRTMVGAHFCARHCDPRRRSPSTNFRPLP